MQTEYWIYGGRIYGPLGFTGYLIDNGHRIVGRHGYTRHWIYRDVIYSTKSGNTGYRIEDSRICGPRPEPPWEGRSH